MHARITGTLLIALVATTAVNAVGCPATLDVNANGGKAWLGMSAGGFIAGEGQSFHNECDGALFTASFQLILDGVTAGGVPPRAFKRSDRALSRERLRDSEWPALVRRS